MHLIDGAGHVNNTFVSEDAFSGRPPTEVTPEIMNALQFEIANVVEGAGFPLDKMDNTQLLSAIRKMIQAGQRSVVINNAAFAPTVTGMGKPVYWDSANSRFDLAIADGSGKQNVVGFADVPNGNVYAFGDAVLFSGLTPGARYYLDATAGGIVTAAPSNAVFLGIARTSTEMFVDVDVASYAPLLNPAFLDSLTLGGAAKSAWSSAVNVIEGSKGGAVVINKNSPVISLYSNVYLDVNGHYIRKNAGSAGVVWLNGGNNLNVFLTNTVGAAGDDITSLLSTPVFSIDVSGAHAAIDATANDGLVRLGQLIAGYAKNGTGRTPSDVTASRGWNTTYTNTSGGLRLVNVSGMGSISSTLYINVSGFQFIGGFSTGNGSGTGCFAIVPPGASYSASFNAGSPTNLSWKELDLI